MPSTEKGIVVRVPGETRSRLEALARSRGRSLNFVMNEAVQRYLTEEAWLIDEISAAVREADSADAVFVPQAEVMARLDVEIEQARQRRAS
jgi:predicted transcriptional regulator